MTERINIQVQDDNGYEFCFSSESLKNESVIGFYFDDTGMPHQIKRESVYGQRILSSYAKLIIEEMTDALS